MRVLWSVFIYAAGILYGVTSVDLPPNDCSLYFQYIRDGDQVVGKLSLTDLPKEKIIVDLMLSQQEFTTGSYIGNMTLWTDVYRANENLGNNEPVEYRVTFATQRELPRVTRIAVNGIEICTAVGYPPPSESIALQHWFTAPNARQSGRTIPLPEGFSTKYQFGEDKY